MNAGLEALAGRCWRAESSAGCRDAGRAAAVAKAMASEDQALIAAPEAADRQA